MMRKPLRVYADTSVFGGVLDTEFRPHSETFFARVRARAIELVISTVVLDELKGAPENVRRFFEDLTPLIERVNIAEDAYALQRAYLRAQVVSQAWEADALHVAVATVSGCRAT